jgi:hypothetical protein
VDVSFSSSLEVVVWYIISRSLRWHLRLFFVLGAWVLVSLLFDKSIDKDVESGRNLKIMGAGSLIPVRL